MIGNESTSNTLCKEEEFEYDEQSEQFVSQASTDISHDKETRKEENSMHSNDETIKNISADYLKTRARRSAVFAAPPSLSDISSKTYQVRLCNENKKLIRLLQKENSELRRHLKSLQKKVNKLEMALGLTTFKTSTASS
jgi:hypothetical protein